MGFREDQEQADKDYDGYVKFFRVAAKYVFALGIMTVILGGFVVLRDSTEWLSWPQWFLAVVITVVAYCIIPKDERPSFWD